MSFRGRVALVALGLVLFPISPSAAAPEGRKLAIVVGVNTYRANSGLPRLKHAADDAASLGGTLREAGYTVVEMTHTVAREEGMELYAPNLAYIRDQIDGILGTPNLGPGDTILISLHGHGVQFERIDDDGQRSPSFYFCPADALIGGLATASDVTERHRLLPLEELYESLGRSRAATKLLIVDACRNEPTQPSLFRSGLASATLPALAPPPGGTAAFFSCAPNQRAIEDPELEHGVFSHFLVKGLSGEADQPVQGRRDNGITLSELTTYVSNHTYAYVARKHGGLKQSPGIQGEFDPNVVIVRVKPQRLPGSETDWPMFRGPGASGLSASVPPTEWGGPDDTNIRWRVPLPGAGPSSPIVVGEQVFVTSATLADEGADENAAETNVARHLTCFDRRTGKQLWEQTVEAPGRFTAVVGKVWGMPAAGTPVSDGRNVYCYFGAGGVYAYSLAGNRVWRASLDDPEEPSGGWRGSSPVVHGQYVLVNALRECGFLYALDRLNGRVQWKWSPAGDEPERVDSLTTPVVHEVGGRPVCFLCEPKGWHRIDIETGQATWTHAGNYQFSFATPIVHGGTALLPNRDGDHLLTVPTDASPTTKPASQHQCTSYTASPIVVGSRLFGMNHTGILWSTPVDDLREQNSPVTRDRGDFKKALASPVATQDHLYITSDHNGVFVYRPDEDGLGPLVATNVIRDDDSAFHGTPAISDGEVFLRSDRYLYCIAR